MQKFKQIDIQLWNPLWNQLSGQSRYQSVNQLWDQLRGKLGYQLGNKLYDKLRSRNVGKRNEAV